MKVEEIVGERALRFEVHSKKKSMMILIAADEGDFKAWVRDLAAVVEGSVARLETFEHSGRIRRDDSGTTPLMRLSQQSPGLDRAGSGEGGERRFSRIRRFGFGRS